MGTAKHDGALRAWPVPPPQSPSQDVLCRAGIAQADGLAAVTPSDSTNAVVAHVARTTYHLDNVVVRNYDPRWRALYEAFGLQVVSSASWGAQRIEEMLSHSPGPAVFSAGNGEVQVYEVRLLAVWQGRTVRDLLLTGGEPAAGCLAVALTRAGRAWLFNELFHADVALNQSEILSRLIAEEMSMGDMMTLLKLRRGQYAVVEEKIPEGAKAVGLTIRDMDLPAECNVAAIIRKGKMVVPHGATVIEAGDEVLAITDREGADRLAALFAAPSYPNRAKP